jgi:hypothetical protein
MRVFANHRETDVNRSSGTSGLRYLEYKMNKNATPGSAQASAAARCSGPAAITTGRAST